MDACRQIARVRPAWAAECEGLLSSYMAQCGRRLSAAEQDEFVVDQFLYADVRLSCEPCLPPNVCALDGVSLVGRFFLQVVDVANVGAGQEQRHEDTPNRLLKMCLTDGAQVIYGIEHAPLRSLSTKTPSGTKVIVQNADVRHGLLMLRSIDVLGQSFNPTLEQPIQAADPSNAGALVPAVSPSNHPRPPVATPCEPLRTNASSAPAQPPYTPVPLPIRAPTTSATHVVPPVRPPSPEPIDLDLSDEERTTDPAIRHLFYGPSTSMPPRQRAAAGPRVLAPPVVALPPARSDPYLPFAYLSGIEAQIAAATSPITFHFTFHLKAFVKSVAAFAYASGYDLKVYIEDGTRTLLVAVAPAFVEQLMGVSCAEFKHAMTVDLPKGAAWVQNMQLRLQSLEGIMSVRFRPGSMPQVEKCQDYSAATAHALRARVASLQAR
ncbi:hypothetical protein SPRG_10359 [Saprolegnia parasitica CBS 223.65]|uniref:RecQ-mediated genome instability protein 1 n=1 Tax=Saprolegnia parasitica (strain CBS 223.65) TaxID=695850 RepID=A0A067C183_SAPPC|nr:hypothetical protein SPRG_10359 [Saprolegnia parasitica CBS 223.65]KDO24544.1 hypothetical protein SPRG_10359 [Saprolegnia parasitica CBS 223.65]|eukprot:XP_012204805.1 hypothetical protein SPRG_10359 [Saprolegnia parasitica CBS 223.65]